MDSFAERIAPLQEARQPEGEPVNGRNLEREARIYNLRDQGPAFPPEVFRAAGELGDCGEELGRASLRAKHLDRGAVRGKRRLRQIDAIELPVVVGAVLQMIDHL